MSPKKKFALKVSAAAGSLAALSGAATARADVVHLDNSNSFSQSYASPQHLWDINGDGTIEFRFRQDGDWLRLDDTGSSLYGRGIVGGDALKNLAADFSVGPNMPAAYQFGGANRDLFYASSSYQLGWLGLGDFHHGFGVDSGFIGFQFDNAGTINYGWASVTVDKSFTNASFTVNEWAYDNSGAGIMVGATVSSVPEPSSLALLSLGAAGVALLRRRREADTQQSSTDVAV